ncbi:hypothetical protein CRV15_35130 (plasmid) [Streptomyces clavuligerus]|nr:hypothetical protein CRV15_35130 [Streptomyces clavuligerus]
MLRCPLGTLRSGPGSAVPGSAPHGPPAPPDHPYEGRSTRTHLVRPRRKISGCPLSPPVSWLSPSSWEAVSGAPPRPPPPPAPSAPPADATPHRAAPPGSDATAPPSPTDGPSRPGQDRQDAGGHHRPTTGVRLRAPKVTPPGHPADP